MQSIIGLIINNNRLALFAKKDGAAEATPSNLTTLIVELGLSFSYATNMDCAYP